MPLKNHNYVVILAGGSGTRLWPRSRESTPKQFLKIASDKTMLQLTYQRALSVVPKEQIIISTNQKHAAMVKEQLPELKDEQILLEPEKKDTALAMLVAALYAASFDPEAVVLNSASDHFIKESDFGEFARTMRQASKLASKHESLITVGITPSYPETGFGYIKVGEQLKTPKDNIPVFAVDNFTEKPNLATAAAFVATGKYFWNANMYVWSAKALVAAFQKYAPEIWQAAACLPKLKGADFIQALPQVFAAAPAISIDYAISEKADNLLLLPGNFSWTDVGDWRVAYELAVKDGCKNVRAEETKLIAYDSNLNYVSSSQGRLVALVGVQDLIVVDTPDIVLIAKKQAAQDVKKIVEEIKKNKEKKYL